MLWISKLARKLITSCQRMGLLLYFIHLMNNYELTVILSVVLSDDEKKKILSKIEKQVEKSNGKIEKNESWGKKKFSYPIRKQQEGDYTFMSLTMTPLEADVLNKSLRLDDKILRHLLVRIS